MQINSVPTNFTFKDARIDLLKSIPNIPCACCGRQTLLPGKREAACQSLEKPLKSVLENLLPILKDKKNVLKILKRIAEAFPNQSLSKIFESTDPKNVILNGLKQFYGNKTSSKEERDKLALQLFIKLKLLAQQDLRSASSVMKRLQSFKKYLSDDYLQVFEQLEIYAQKYPRKSLSEIVQTNEVYNFHKKRNKLYQQHNQDKYNFHIANISKILKQPIEIVDMQLKKIINNEPLFPVYDAKTKKGKLKNSFENKLAEYNLDAHKKEKILSEIDKLPFEESFVDKFFILAFEKKLSDRAIIDRLINPQERSFEHIIPQLLKGKSHISNGMILCRHCNTSRQAIPYTEYLQYHPEMIVNTQKQIDYISKLILSGKLESDLMDWPIKVAKTLTYYTHGLIKIDTSAYAIKALRKAKKQVKEMQEEKKQIKQTRKQIKKQLKELDEKSEQISSKIQMRENFINSIKK